MFHLTESQITAIKWLATYKYLTSSQFVKMGLYKRRGYLTNALKVLVGMKKALLAKHDFNPINGKLESFYYLTNYGKKFLLDELEYTKGQIKAPKGLSPIYLKDYFHRKLTIDFHVYLNQWLEANDGKVNFLNYYFDKSGNNRSVNSNNHVAALNRIQLDSATSFIPDINTMFTLGGQKYLYVFEQHNGKDAKRLFEQLYVHIIALSKGVVSEKYNIKKPHVVAIVCEYESVKMSVIHRLQEERGIERYNNLLLFKTNAELEDDFYENWTQISGEQVSFIPTLFNRDTSS